MANYKLAQDFWETSGVFDVAQNKTQREINSVAAKSKDTQTISGAIASFDDGVEGVPIKNLTVNIELVRSGTGDPSPDNIRPITGWTGANVYRSDADTTNPTTYSITFPAEAGTVYGGTLEIKDDGNGVLTVSKKSVEFNGTEAFTLNNASMHEFRSPSTYSLKRTSSGGRGVSNFLTFYYTGSGYTYNLSDRIYIKWPSASTLAEFKAALASLYSAGTPLVIVHDLVTPVVYNLTAPQIRTLLGQNNIWADCGDVTVEYGAYLTVIENQFGEKIPKVAVAPIEKTTTASKAYAVNELFFMGDKLYIATASIASGATFTVGTNCAETTLGEQIAALLNA